MIRPSSSPWSSPVWFVRKKGGTLRSVHRLLITERRDQEEQLPVAENRRVLRAPRSNNGIFKDRPPQRLLASQKERSPRPASHEYRQSIYILATEYSDWPAFLPDHLKNGTIQPECPIELADIIHRKSSHFEYDDSQKILYRKLSETERAAFCPFIRRVDVVVHRRHRGNGQLSADAIWKILQLGKSPIKLKQQLVKVFLDSACPAV
ncbi:hypothetical protein NQZ79_g3817 [Umbelopsis isabellina]|nr:hypothetical protein NQZ79_g3817 [Umbelopsis isabellina]